MIYTKDSIQYFKCFVNSNFQFNKEALRYFGGVLMGG
jgi:hypothetical protein